MGPLRGRRFTLAVLLDINFVQALAAVLVVLGTLALPVGSASSLFYNIYKLNNKSTLLNNLI